MLTDMLVNAVAGRSPVLAQAAGETASASGAVGLSHFLIVGALTFGIGLMLVITRRNAVAVLMGVELLLNSAGLNFVAFAKYSPAPVVDGQIVTLFIIVIAAAEAAVGIAIVLNIYNKLNTVEVPEARSLSG